MTSALPDSFVRPAVVSDLETIGAIHAETMAASLKAALDADLPPDVSEVLTAENLAGQWSLAITAPPSSGHRVLTAMEGARIVGFASYAPADQQLSGGEDEADRTIVEILALEVPSEHGRKGHGSRLLAAIADGAKDADELQVWIGVGDEAKTRFYTGAGFGPRGLQRTLAVGTHQITEQCWYAVLSGD